MPDKDNANHVPRADEHRNLNLIAGVQALSVDRDATCKTESVLMADSMAGT
jgi:hypothetical protein